ncbi:MAG: hypothetical protein V1826_03105 [bacterium]
MPNIMLIGFGNGVTANTVIIPLIAEAVRTLTNLADKTVITNFPRSTCVSAADVTKQMPYFCICNTNEEGTVEELETLTEVLKQFGYDIEWGDIKEFFAAPTFERWTTVHQKSG